MTETELSFDVKKIHGMAKHSDLETSCTLCVVTAPDLAGAVLTVMAEMKLSGFMTNMRVDIEKGKKPQKYTCGAW